MSDSDRTEEPTPRRLREARQRGEVARSRDLTAVVSLGFVLAAIAAAVVPALGALLAATAATLGSAGHADEAGIAAEVTAWGWTAAGLAVPVLAAAAAAALAAGWVQTGGLFTLEPLRPRLERLDPVRGARRLFGLRGWVEAGRSVVKFVVLAAAAVLAAHHGLPGLLRSARADAASVAAALGDILLRAALGAGAALLLVAVVDVAWQRHRHRRDLRMTRAEVKREQRDEEGDPQLRARRRQMHRELIAHRMVLDVPRATCVVVNPTHVAVALRYDGDDDDAVPLVLARGEGDLARRIVEAARAAGVPILRNAPVARSLLACELGEAIPERLYEAVAEVLRVVIEAERG
jgi:flagellar biosynthesis protein FlhB